jgi:hypothetical protein
MPPLALTDSELDAVYRAAGPIPPAVRGAFLEEVAQRLAGRELGDGCGLSRRYGGAAQVLEPAGSRPGERYLKVALTAAATLGRSRSVV